jgi:hypothetical protein
VVEALSIWAYHWRLIDQLFSVSASTSPFTGRALPEPTTFKVSVENGSGIALQAQNVAAGLAAKGYRVSTVGERTPTGPLTETVVWYGGAPPPVNANWKNPGLEGAQSIMGQLEGPAIMGYNPALVTLGALVTVQTGTGLTLKPTEPTTATTLKSTTSSFTSSSLPTLAIQLAAANSTSSTTTTTTTTTIPDPGGIASNSNFGSPRATNPTLEAWDSRACNAAGTGPSSAP